MLIFEDIVNRKNEIYFFYLMSIGNYQINSFYKMIKKFIIEVLIEIFIHSLPLPDKLKIALAFVSMIFYVCNLYRKIKNENQNRN